MATTYHGSMIMTEPLDFDEHPEKTAYHANKRELLRRGREQGELSWEEITDALPPAHISDVEMEVFLFTCKSLGIEVKGRP